MATLYDFHARTLTGDEIDFSRYAGMAVLVVNTASRCGLTPQFAGLETLYRKHAASGFVVLGFPCNQFGNQEPGNAGAIGAFCSMKYDVTFPIFEKVEVNGPKAHPLFVWLTTELPGTFGPSVQWNFTKFLIGRDGVPERRYAPIARPSVIERDLVRLPASGAKTKHFAGIQAREPAR
jgi:glutathione peroxidase